MSALLYPPEYYVAKQRAYTAVAKARRLGQIVPQPCERCGATPTDGHHRWGYEGENALRLVWLCGQHHGDEHYRMRQVALGYSLAPCIWGPRCKRLVWASPDSRYRYCPSHMLRFIDGERPRRRASKENAA